MTQRDKAKAYDKMIAAIKAMARETSVGSEPDGDGSFVSIATMPRALYDAVEAFAYPVWNLDRAILKLAA